MFTFSEYLGSRIGILKHEQIIMLTYLIPAYQPHIISIDDR